MISLFEAFGYLKTDAHFEAFLKDLCTPSEIRDFKERFGVAQLLYKETLSYREIHKETGASLATITRVARFLKQEPHQGYVYVLSQGIL
jgi:TrpR-related protein YerC/YecD